MTEEKLQRYVYLGKRKPLKFNKLVHAFGEENDLDYFVFWKKAKAYSFAGAKIGHIYELGQHLDDGKLWADREVGKLSDEECVKLQVESKLAIRLHTEKSIEPDYELQQALTVLRKARYKTPIRQYDMFDAWLLNQVRKTP